MVARDAVVLLDIVECDPPELHEAALAPTVGKSEVVCLHAHRFERAAVVHGLRLKEEEKVLFVLGGQFHRKFLSGQ